MAIRIVLEVRLNSLTMIDGLVSCWPLRLISNPSLKVMVCLLKSSLNVGGGGGVGGGWWPPRRPEQEVSSKVFECMYI